MTVWAQNHLPITIAYHVTKHKKPYKSCSKCILAGRDEFMFIDMQYSTGITYKMNICFFLFPFQSSWWLTRYIVWSKIRSLQKLHFEKCSKQRKRIKLFIENHCQLKAKNEGKWTKATSLWVMSWLALYWATTALRVSWMIDGSTLSLKFSPRVLYIVGSFSGNGLVRTLSPIFTFQN